MLYLEKGVLQPGAQRLSRRSQCLYFTDKYAVQAPPETGIALVFLFFLALKMFSPGRVFFLFCSSLLINNVAAIAPGLLGIQINDGLARGPAHKIVLESIATIRGFDLWNDSQIVDLVGPTQHWHDTPIVVV